MRLLGRWAQNCERAHRFRIGAQINYAYQAPTVQSLRPGIPDDLDRIVMACLSKDPSARPSGAAAVLADGGARRAG